MEGMLQPYDQCSGPNNCTVLTLDSNRLSGNIPPSFTEAGGVNILSGNLFQCEPNNIPQYDPKREGYICGSLTLDVSFISWGVLGILTIGSVNIMWPLLLLVIGLTKLMKCDCC